MNPLDMLPTEPKMLTISMVVFALMGFTLLLMIAIVAEALVKGEPPRR